MITPEDPDYLLIAGTFLVFITLVTCLCALTFNLDIENPIEEFYSSIPQLSKPLSQEESNSHNFGKGSKCSFLNGSCFGQVLWEQVPLGG